MELAFARQDETPLFPKILWNRPVSRNGAGRLLLPGGHSGDFSLPTAIYELAMAAGAGECQVALPDTLVKFLGGSPSTMFVPSSPSGSLGKDALGALVAASEEADGLLIGAGLSNNSHTSILIEQLLRHQERPVVAFGDALVALQYNLRLLTDNPNCLLIVTMPEVFKLAGQLDVPIHIRPDGGLLNKLEIIASLAAASKCDYVVYGSEIIVASGDGEPVVTPVNYRLSLAPAAYYGVLGVFWIQNLKQRRAGLATGSFVLREISRQLGANEQPTVSKLAAAIRQVVNQDDF